MDQASFRQLLQAPRSTGISSTSSRGSLLPSSGSSSKPKKQNAPEQDLKPRKVKTTESKYRDRASERRVGEGNDFADVEALLKEFEERTVDNDDRAAVDEQRKYLGGDAQHSVLVKGLDFSLLEQTKARAAATHDAEDEDELERAFELAKRGPVIDADTSKSTALKRSRADLLKDLKATRGASGETAVEKVIDVKETGKFKPIGFKPIGGTETNATTKKKKKKVKGVGPEGERTKKRRKVDSEPAVNAAVAQPTPATSTSVPTSETLASAPAPALPKAPIVEATSALGEDDFDIFAGVGDYEGVDLGDSSGEEDSTKPTQVPDETTGSSSLPLPGRRGWFDDPESENEPETVPEPVSSVTLISHAPQAISSDVENEDDQPSRLMPLMASAVPSIKDMLAADEELAKEEKRRARKEKRKRAAA